MSLEESLTDTQPWAQERLPSALADSALLKSEGNASFAQQNWQNAIVAYQQALDALPPSPTVDRRDKGRGNEEGSEEGGEQQNTIFKDKESSQTESEPEKEDSASNQPQTPLQKECSAARVVLLSNMSQCHIKLVRSSEPPLLL
jgi:hypothetical protein